MWDILKLSISKKIKNKLRGFFGQLMSLITNWKHYRNHQASLRIRRIKKYIKTWQVGFNNLWVNYIIIIQWLSYDIYDITSLSLNK
jgi:hypothetical protein